MIKFITLKFINIIEFQRIIRNQLYIGIIQTLTIFKEFISLIVIYSREELMT